MATLNTMQLFSLDADRAFAERVARHLGTVPAQHEERDFEDGEHKIRPLENVRGKDVYVVQSLHGDPNLSVNDKLIRLCFLLGALRDTGADRLTLICPYLAYARKDRRTKAHDPLSFRYLAQMIEAMKVDQVVTMDVHDLAAYQNAFRCPTVHLSWRNTLVEHLEPILRHGDVTVASPDVGGVKRANPLREALENTLDRPVGLAFMEKHRNQGVVSGELVAGDLKDRTVVLIDDLIASGGTLTRAAEAYRQAGALKIIACATHGVFSSQSSMVLATPDIEHIMISNSLAPWRLGNGKAWDKLTVLDVSEQIARAIEHNHRGREIDEAVKGRWGGRCARCVGLRADALWKPGCRTRRTDPTYFA